LRAIALLRSPALLLIFPAASASSRIALGSLGLGGPHGLSEIIYAYASSAADNGSAFAGLNANTTWFNTTTARVMFLGRFAHAIPVLAIAGSLAEKKKFKTSAGGLSTRGPLFVIFLIVVIGIFTLLQYLPALALGPIAESLLASRGTTF
jgi:K+-transporting ATPase ATPase A chain